MSQLTIRGTLGVNDWRDSFDLAIGRQVLAPVIVNDELLRMGAFAMSVPRIGATKMYPEGTVLVVVPLDQWAGTLRFGYRVILQRIRDRVEVTAREIEVQDGRAWLWPRSTTSFDPAGILPVEMPWPPPSRTWKKGEDRFLIAGVVVQALIPEGQVFQ